MSAADIPPRERILNVAGELFQRQGYGAVSLDAVIAKSGMASGTVHQHFNSKTKLGVAWLERLMRRMRVMHQTFMERPGTREQRLKKYFNSMRSWLEANGFRSCQFANTAACIGDEDDEIIQLIDQYKRSQHRFFVELVKTLVPEEDVKRLGTTVFLLYSGAMTEAQNLKASWPLEDALATAELLCGIE